MTKWLPAWEERREILDVKAVAHVLGCSISHASNILTGKVPGLPPINRGRPFRASATRMLGHRQHNNMDRCSRDRESHRGLFGEYRSLSAVALA
jgi:hypothetical protein